jgi:hypothetical protein
VSLCVLFTVPAKADWCVRYETSTSSRDLGRPDSDRDIRDTTLEHRGRNDSPAGQISIEPSSSRPGRRIYPVDSRRYPTLDSLGRDATNTNASSTNSYIPGSAPNVQPATSASVASDPLRDFGRVSTSTATTSAARDMGYETTAASETTQAHVTSRVQQGFDSGEAQDRVALRPPRPGSITARPELDTRTSQLLVSTSASSATRFESCLPSGLVRQFAQIKRSQFAEVQDFVVNNPDILHIVAKPLRDEAVKAYSVRNRTYGDSCLQQYLILVNVQRNPADRAPRFLSALRDRESDTRLKFYEAFDSNLLKIQAELTNNSSTPRDTVAESIRSNPSTSWPSGNKNHVSIASAPVAHNLPARPSVTFPDSAVPPSDVRLEQSIAQGNPAARTGAFPASTFYQQPLSQAALSYPSSTFPGYGPRSTEPSHTHSNPGQYDPTYSTTPTGPGGVGNTAPSHGETPRQPPSTQLFLVPENHTIHLNPSGQDQLNWRYVERHSSFYQRGKVFAVLWHENYHKAGGEKHRRSGTAWISDTFDLHKISPGKFNQEVYSSIRRMVVVQARRGFCVCIQINSYGGRGLDKFKDGDNDIEAHSRIYVVGTRPQWLTKEPHSSKRDVAVVPADPTQRLTPASRLCYSRPYTVEHTVKSMDVGKIDERDLAHLLKYFRQAQEDD